MTRHDPVIVGEFGEAALRDWMDEEGMGSRVESRLAAESGRACADREEIPVTRGVAAAAEGEVSAAAAGLSIRPSTSRLNEDEETS